MDMSSSGSSTHSVTTETICSSDYKDVSSHKFELGRTNQFYQPPVSSPPKAGWNIAAASEHVIQFWLNTIHDIEQAPWKWMIRRFWSHILPIMLIPLAGVLMGVWVAVSVKRTNISDVCKPDGSFSLLPTSYDVWKSLFIIDLAFGSYSFGIAKLIDISWDMLVGRGGQTLLAFISYRVFTRSLVRFMETSTVSQDTFKAITLQDNTVWGILMLIKDFLKNNGLRARFTMFWILWSGVFVLIFPTWVSAMTGYTAEVQTVVRDRSENMVPAKEFHPVVYILHDGSRVGLTDDFPITVPWTTDVGPELATFGSAVDEGYHSGMFGCMISPDGASRTNALECMWMWSVSDYARTYGFFGLTVTKSKFSHPNGSEIDLVSDQPLNISAYFYNESKFLKKNSGSSRRFTETDDPRAIPYGYFWTRNGSNVYPLQTNNTRYYNAASKTMYDLATYNERGMCAPAIDLRYRWGFSFIILFVFIIVFLIWMIGMWSIYLDSFLHSRFSANGRNLGTERAVLDLSIAMHEKLSFDEVALYSNDKVQRILKNERITYNELPLDLLEKPARQARLSEWWKAFEVKPWVRAEKRWLFTLAAFTVLFVANLSSRLGTFWLRCIFLTPILGVVCVLAIGRGVRSRWVAFAFWLLLFIVGEIVWFTLFAIRTANTP